MKNFKYPLAIQGNKEQLGALIPKLVDLGYSKNICYGDLWSPDRPYLLTNFIARSGYIIGLGFNETPSENKIVSASNPDLVLALAAMVDDDKAHIGEYWYIYPNLVKVIEVRQDDGWFWFEGAYYNDYEYKTLQKNWHSPISYVHRKATKEEIINHFMKQDQKIIGYKLKDSCKKYTEAIANILGINRFYCCTSGPDLTLAYNIDKLKEAGVLDIWFEPVYEYKDKTVIVKCDSGDFEVKVNRDGVFFIGDPISVPQLRGLCEVKYLNKYDVLLTKVNIGCKKGVDVQSIREIITVYDTL